MFDTDVYIYGLILLSVFYCDNGDGHGCRVVFDLLQADCMSTSTPNPSDRS